MVFERCFVGGDLLKMGQKYGALRIKVERHVVVHGTTANYSKLNWIKAL